MNVSQAESIDRLYAGLALSSPAFLLLDIDMEGSKHFLAEVAKNVLALPPYIIVAGNFSPKVDFASMLDLGADACISKPINASAILSVINSVFRRERKVARLHLGRLLPCFEYKDLMIDPLRRVVEMRNKPVMLTVKEFDILYLLASHSGNVLTKEEIYRSVWNTEYDYAATNVSDHISMIRQKLKLGKKDRDYIQTVFGVGYRFASEE